MNNYYKTLNEIAAVFDMDQWDEQVNLFTNVINEQLNYFIYRMPRVDEGNKVRILGGGSHCSFYGGYGKVYVEDKQINSNELEYNGFIDISEYREKGLKEIHVIIKDLSETIATHHESYGCASMFSQCTYLVEVPWFDTSKITDMACMFWCCTSLVNVPKLDISNVISMGSMFFGCESLSEKTKEIWGEIYDFDNNEMKKITE